jgi:hypothetical protein
MIIISAILENRTNGQKLDDEIKEAALKKNADLSGYTGLRNQDWTVTERILDSYWFMTQVETRPKGKK